MLSNIKKLVQGNRAPVLLLILIFLIAEIIINPIGAFPLNDDWSYTRSLQNLLAGEYHLTGFTSMPLAGQLVWACFFCKVFGFSFTLLRLTTLLLGICGIVGSYFLTRELSGSRALAFAVGLLVMFNPIFLNLANTFMTDVPFFAMLVMSMLCLVKGLRKDRSSWIIAGLAFVCAATMIRQLGLLVAAAFAITIILQRWRTPKQRWLTAVGAIGAPLGIYLLYNLWLSGSGGGTPVMYHEGTRQIFYNVLYSGYSKPVFLVKQVLNIFCYCGFFVFPLLVLCSPMLLGRSIRRLVIYCGVLLLFVAGYYIFFRRLMPYTGNIINPYGLGTRTLRDIMVLKADHLPTLPWIFWLLMTLTGCLGGAWLLYLLVRYFPFKLRRNLETGLGLTMSFRVKEAMEAVFLYYFLGLYLLVMLVGASFDRYFLPVVPVIGALTAFTLVGRRRAPAYLSLRSLRIRYRVAVGVIMFYGLFSTIMTAEYLSWNRARWTALNDLMKDGHVAPASIDGGFEFNGYYLYDDTMMQLEEDKTKKSWWWVKDDAYLISFGPVDGYIRVKEYPYRRPLRSPGKILVLKRQEP